MVVPGAGFIYRQVAYPVSFFINRNVHLTEQLVFLSRPFRGFNHPAFSPINPEYISAIGKIAKVIDIPVRAGAFQPEGIVRVRHAEEDVIELIAGKIFQHRWHFTTGIYNHKI